MAKNKAAIDITITSEDGEKVERHAEGTNTKIAFWLGELGILLKEERKILCCDECGD